MDALPQISLGTAALIIFGAIASLAVLRGLLRILWGSLVLCLAGFTAFLAWQHAPSLSRELLGREAPAAGWLAPAIVFVLAIVLLRLLVRAVFVPLRQPDADAAERHRRSPLRWALTLILSLGPAALICFGAATLLRHAGSVAEIRAFAETEQPSTVPPFLAKLKSSIEHAIPAAWLDRIDPFAEEARLKLAKLISTADSPPPKAIPVLEETQIRELIDHDSTLRELARQGRYAELLRDPRLGQLLENQQLRDILTRTTF